MIHEADVIAIRRAYATSGKDAALVELRRRYLGLTDQNAPAILDRLLAMPVEPPAPFATRGGTHIDQPGRRRNRGG